MDLSAKMILFAKVVDEGSFSGAARVLNQAPSSISRQIALLEDQMAVRLVSRTTKGIVVTDEGRAFYDRCRIVAHEVDQARTMLDNIVDHAHGQLTVVSSVAFGKSQLIPRLPRFQEEYPEVQVVLQLTDATADLADMRADVAIRYSEQIRDASVVSRKLAVNRRIFVAAPSYLAKAGMPSDLASLSAHRCLRISSVTELNDWIPATAQTSFTAESADTVRYAAIAGMGVARLAEFHIGADLKAGRLVRVLPQFVQEDSNINVTFADRRNMAPRIRVFINFLIDEFSGRTTATGTATKPLAS